MLILNYPCKYDNGYLFHDHLLHICAWKMVSLFDEIEIHLKSMTSDMITSVDIKNNLESVTLNINFIIYSYPADYHRIAICYVCTVMARKITRSFVVNLTTSKYNSRLQWCNSLKICIADSYKICYLDVVSRASMW